MIGINIRNEKDYPFADMIVDGLKTIETRESPSLHCYAGRRVAIVRTGQGKALAIGEVTISYYSWTNGIHLFDSFYDGHKVGKGSAFYINPKKGKYLYHLENPVRYDTPLEVAQGIVARKVLK